MFPLSALSCSVVTLQRKQFFFFLSVFAGIGNITDGIPQHCDPHFNAK